jgi:prepilin-type N-terminal cleavage/methylation domain-containing protein
MVTSIVRYGERQPVRKQTEGGFTLIEVMISMVVLTVGLVTLLGVFGIAMATTQTSQQDMIAKQLANEALESIITARNTAQLQWDQVQNAGTGNGIFLTGLQPIKLAGVDGIVGTTDDTAAATQFLHTPGPDGIYGNSDDVQLPLTNYQRQVTISDVQDVNNNVVSTLRGINITIQYSTPKLGVPKTYVLSSLISQYR